MMLKPSDGFGTPPTEEFTRKAPHSIEVEQEFLGCLLIWNEVLDDGPELLPSQFWDPLHAMIYDAAATVIRSGRKATHALLAEALKDAPAVDNNCTAVQYLGKLASVACHRSSAADYAQKIVDLYVRRALILAGEDLAQSSREAILDASPLSLIEEAEARLFRLANESIGAGDTSLKFEAAVFKAVEAANAAYKGSLSGIPTGIVGLDAKLGGLNKSDLIILAGRPSMGKTALATNFTVNVAASGVPVDFYSLEMSGEQLAMRVLSAKAGIPADKFRRGFVDEAGMKSLVMAAKDVGALPIYIDQTGGISIAQLVARARRNKRKRNTGLIVVDYIQLMQAASSRRNGNRVQDITEITTGLKALAKELDVPVLALSQLSRNVEHREDKRPQLSDLRESGSIEQDADVVMFCFREDYYVEREQPSTEHATKFSEWQAKLQACTGKAEVIVGKQRHGPIGIVPLAFDGRLTRFSDLNGGRP